MQSWKQRATKIDPKFVRGTEGLKEWQARLLAARGADTPEKIARYLSPSFGHLAAPETLPGITEAVRVLEDLKREKPGARIAVYGDYDVDGVCASAIMKEALDGLGFETQVYIPDRHEEGYGLNGDAVRHLREGTAFADPWPADALVTVDCGITSLEEVRLARELGMKVIVTDHHTRLEQLPEADAVVSPVLDGPEGEEHFRYLCGAGVALKAAWALHGPRFALERCDLCALATVADVVALEGENRDIVAEGLRKMNTSPRTGIRALIEAAGGAERKDPVTAMTVGYQLAPRLNAAGRLESAMLSCRLMLTEDAAEARDIAARLDRLNNARKDCQERVIAEAEEQAKKMCLRDLRALVCTGDGWDSGVVGLAAGKLAEKYACPTVCLARKGDMYVGSARSACDVDLYAAMSACSDLFERFGGHRAAAGVSLRADRVDEFRERLSRAVEEQLGGRDLIPVAEYDAEMPLGDVTLENAVWIRSLEPFGMGNPSPVFLFRDVLMEGKRAVGRDLAHLQCSLAKDGEMRRGIYFRGAEWLGAPLGRMNVLAVPGENTFNHKTSVQLQIRSAEQLPDMLEKEEARETEVLLKDLTDIAANSQSVPPAADPLLPPAADAAPSWLGEKRGTLVLCRTLETARSWKEAWPSLSMITGSADDPRAFTALGLYVPLETVSPFYRRVILADGQLPGEAAYLRRNAPDRLCADGGEGECALRERVVLTREGLRKVYLALKLRSRLQGLKGMTRTELEKEAGMAEERLYCALSCLAEAGLIRFTWSPFRAEMEPFKKADPDATVWGKLVLRG